MREVEQYRATTMKKSDIERQENHEKTGVFTGAYAINPANGERVPIWVGDFVIADYGTGAILATPSHDERDWEFARKFKLPLRQTLMPDGVDEKMCVDMMSGKKFDPAFHDEGVMINSDPFDWLDSSNHKDWRVDWAKSQNLIPEYGEPDDRETQVYGACVILYNPKTNKYLGLRPKEDPDLDKGIWIPGGNLEPGETFEQCARRETKEETGYAADRLVRLGPPIISHYFNRPKKCYRRSFAAHYIAIIDGEPGESAREPHEDFSNHWLDYDEIYAGIGSAKGERGHWLDLLQRAKRFVDNGLEVADVDDPSFNGLSSPEMREKVVKWLATRGVARFRTTYKMRDWLISRQRYWGAPIPIAYDKDGKEHLIPDKDLPVVLPPIDDYKPDDSGRSALAKSPEFMKVIIDGEEMTRETDTMDGFACSSWYLLRFADPRNGKHAWDPKKVNHWNPVDYYVGGEHSTTHMLYVRMWTLFFRDLGLTDFAEPIAKFMKNGQILATDGTKMSKSKGNTVDPLEIINSGYGADALRTYILFMSPPDMDVAWNLQGLGGVHRFLGRVWNLVQEFIDATEASNDAGELNRIIHKTIKKVTNDIRRNNFNTAIAALMECTNELYKLKENGFSEEWRVALSNMMLVMAPFAPHMAAELYESLGNKQMIEQTPWPEWDEKYLATDTMTIAVQVNGKLRATIDVPTDLNQPEIEKIALKHENVMKFVGDKKPKKIIYVPGKIVNIVA